NSATCRWAAWCCLFGRIQSFSTEIFAVPAGGDHNLAHPAVYSRVRLGLNVSRPSVANLPRISGPPKPLSGEVAGPLFPPASGHGPTAPDPLWCAQREWAKSLGQKHALVNPPACNSAGRTVRWSNTCRQGETP